MSKTGLERPLNRRGRRISTAVSGGVLIAMIGLTAACSSESSTPEESTTTPTTTTTTTTTSEPTLSPTEKNVGPDGGAFTPPVTAPQPTLKHPDDD